MSKETEQPEEPHSKLGEEDLARVESVIHSGINSVERKPFRPWRLLGIIGVMIVVLGQGSIMLADYYLSEKEGGFASKRPIESQDSLQ